MAVNQNHVNEYRIGPYGSTASHVISSHIQSVDVSDSQGTQEYDYYHLQGSTERVIETSESTYTFSGHRDTDDEAQNFILSKFMAVGNNAKVSFEHTRTDGSVLTSVEATISDITPTGGDSKSRETFGFTVTVTKATISGVPAG